MCGSQLNLQHPLKPPTSPSHTAGIQSPYLNQLKSCHESMKNIQLRIPNPSPVPPSLAHPLHSTLVTSREVYLSFIYCCIKWNRPTIMPGYDARTVEPLKIALICPECSLFLRDAVQIDNGVRLCESCFNTYTSKCSVVFIGKAALNGKNSAHFAVPSFLV